MLGNGVEVSWPAVVAVQVRYFNNDLLACCRQAWPFVEGVLNSSIFRACSLLLATVAAFRSRSRVVPQSTCSPSLSESTACRQSLSRNWPTSGESRMAS